MRIATAVKSLSVIAALCAFASPAMARQCVWNKGGFVLRVDWFSSFVSKQENVGRSTAPMTLEPKWLFNISDPPDKTDKLTAGTGACIEPSARSQSYYAVLSIYGGDVTYSQTRYYEGYPADKKLEGVQWEVLQPPSDRYVDVWGGIWNPQKGPGGPIKP